MAQDNWNYYCGHNTSVFEVWDREDFDRCFEQSFIICFAHAILAVISVQQISDHRHRSVSEAIPHILALHIRFVACGLLTITPLVFMAVMYLYLDHVLSFSDILTLAIKTISFLSHSAFVWMLKRFYHIHIRGNKLTLVAYILTVIANFIELRSNILREQRSATHIDVERIISYMTSLLHLIYLISLAPNHRPSLYMTRNNSDREPLISSLRSINRYDINSSGD